MATSHGDVVQLTNAAGAVTRDYRYDAFGVEQNPDDTDTNPWRYCGEYYDLSSGTYYLRARYYEPTTGRFLTEDTHWNVNNSIYGDNPVKINERKDPLGLNVYTYVPDINAIRQSTNIYVYCGNNPILYIDSTGKAYEATAGFAGSMWWLTMVDGPVLPFGDIAYGFGVAGCAVVDTVNMIGIDKIYAAGEQLVNWVKGWGGGGGTASPGDPNWNGGFNSFGKLKNYLGSAGKGNEWHHIVEQSQIKKSGFDKTIIHNVNNVIKVSKDVHNKITGHYNSNIWVNGQKMKVRDWLAGQSFEKQYQYGLDLLKQFGVIK